jgi:HEPN domain-containing protein
MNDDILDVGEWIRYAQEDYDCAVAVAQANHPYSARKACFDCQQSAEKILKAYTIAKYGTRIKEHDLRVLLRQCKQYAPDFNELDTDCSALNMYISLSRYPLGTNLTDSDMNQSLAHAHKILEFTKSKLKDLGYEYAP